MSNRTSTDIEDQAIVAFRDGKTFDQIAAMTKLTFKTVSRILRRRGVTKTGHRSSGTELPAAVQAKICRQYAAGEKCEVIATENDVVLSTIPIVVRRNGGVVRPKGNQQQCSANGKNVPSSPQSARFSVAVSQQSSQPQPR